MAVQGALEYLPGFCAVFLGWCICFMRQMRKWRVRCLRCGHGGRGRAWVPACRLCSIFWEFYVCGGISVCKKCWLKITQIIVPSMLSCDIGIRQPNHACFPT
eukprot:scaffold115282_cov17-Tisochrysis_lutea.AAC.1